MSEFRVTNSLAPAEFEDVEFIAMLHGGYGGGFGGQILAEIEGQWSDVGDAGGRLLRGVRGAGGEEQK